MVIQTKHNQQHINNVIMNKKRKLSPDAARYVVESVEQIDVNKQFSVVTSFMAGDAEVPAGKLVNVTSLEEDVVKFNMLDNADVILTTDKNTFAANTQLMDNDIVSEGLNAAGDWWDAASAQDRIAMLEKQTFNHADATFFGGKSWNELSMSDKEMLHDVIIKAGYVSEGADEQAAAWWGASTVEEHKALVKRTASIDRKEYDTIVSAAWKDINPLIQGMLIASLKAEGTVDEAKMSDAENWWKDNNREARENMLIDAGINVGTAQDIASAYWESLRSAEKQLVLKSLEELEYLDESAKSKRFVNEANMVAARDWFEDHFRKNIVDMLTAAGADAYTARDLASKQWDSMSASEQELIGKSLVKLGYINESAETAAIWDAADALKRDAICDNALMNDSEKLAAINKKYAELPDNLKNLVDTGISLTDEGVDKKKPIDKVKVGDAVKTSLGSGIGKLIDVIKEPSEIDAAMKKYKPANFGGKMTAKDFANMMSPVRGGKLPLIVIEVDGKIFFDAYDFGKTWVNEALDMSALTIGVVASYLLQSVTEAHRIHLNNEYPAGVNGNAAHGILREYYEDMPELVDSLIEQLRYDGVSVVAVPQYTWLCPLAGIVELIAAIDTVYDSVDNATRSELDGIKSFLKKFAWRLQNQANFVYNPELVSESLADWDDMSAAEKLDKLKLAIMSDKLDYNAADFVSKPIASWPEELKAAVEIVCEAMDEEDWMKLGDEEKEAKIAKVLVANALGYDAATLAKTPMADWPEEVRQAFASFVFESKAQDEYRKFFLGKLEAYGVTSPAQLTEEQKKEFFNSIKAEWPKVKAEVLNESATSGALNKFEFAKKYAETKDINKLAALEKIFRKNSITDDYAIDVAYGMLSTADQKAASAAIGADYVDEAFKSRNVRRSFALAKRWLNESLDAGENVVLLNALTTTDGTVLPAGTEVAYTSFDNNTNVATITVGENSYAVTLIDLATAAGK